MQVHYTWPNGKGSLLVGVEPTRPSYARLVEMLKVVPNTRASRSWVDRVLDINNLKGMYAPTGSVFQAQDFWRWGFAGTL